MEELDFPATSVERGAILAADRPVDAGSGVGSRSLHLWSSWSSGTLDPGDGMEDRFQFDPIALDVDGGPSLFSVRKGRDGRERCREDGRRATTLKGSIPISPSESTYVVIWLWYLA